MLKKLFLAVAVSAVAASAIAHDSARAAAEKVIELKDGSTVYIFKDGKMAMEDQYGRATRMEPLLSWNIGKALVAFRGEVLHRQTITNKPTAS